MGAAPGWIARAADYRRAGTRLIEKLLAKSGPIGRELEFLVQEMGREVQTVGSKVQDTALLTKVREAKASLEKLREQVANFE